MQPNRPVSELALHRTVHIKRHLTRVSLKHDGTAKTRKTSPIKAWRGKMARLKHIWRDSRCRRSKTGTQNSPQPCDGTDGKAKTWRDRRQDRRRFHSWQFNVHQLKTDIVDVLHWNFRHFWQLQRSRSRMRTATTAQDQHRQGDLTARIHITLFTGRVTPALTSNCRAIISGDWRRPWARRASTVYGQVLIRTRNKPPSDNDYNRRHLVRSRYGCVTWQRPSLVVGRCRAANEVSWEYFRSLFPKY